MYLLLIWKVTLFIVNISYFSLVAENHSATDWETWSICSNEHVIWASKAKDKSWKWARCNLCNCTMWVVVKHSYHSTLFCFNTCQICHAFSHQLIDNFSGISHSSIQVLVVHNILGIFHVSKLSLVSCHKARYLCSLSHR